MLATFREAAAQHGIPASTLTDNGMVYTTRFSGGRGGRNAFEHELRRLGHRPEELPPQPPHHLRQGRALPADPEELAAAQPDQPTTIAELQALLDQFRTTYNHHRPHRSLPHRATPATALHHHAQGPTRPRAATPTPTTASATTASTSPAPSPCASHGQLRHIGIGRTHARTHVILLVQDLHVRVINATTGELLRELTIDPNRDYQPRTPTMTNARTHISVGSGVRDVLRHHMAVAVGFEPTEELPPHTLSRRAP